MDNYKNELTVRDLTAQLNALSTENIKDKQELMTYKSKYELLIKQTEESLQEKENTIKEMSEEHFQLMYILYNIYNRTLIKKLEFNLKEQEDQNANFKEQYKNIENELNKAQKEISDVKNENNMLITENVYIILLYIL